MQTTSDIDTNTNHPPSSLSHKTRHKNNTTQHQTPPEYRQSRLVARAQPPQHAQHLDQLARQASKAPKK